MSIEQLALSGVPSSAVLADTLSLLNGRRPTFRIINSMFPLRVAFNVSARGGAPLSPACVATDSEIRQMLRVPGVRHGFHFSPLTPRDAFAGAQRLWEELGPVHHLQVGQPSIADNATWPDRLLAFRIWAASQTGVACDVTLQIGPQLLDGVATAQRRYSGLCRPGSTWVDPERLVQWLMPFAMHCHRGLGPISGVLLDRSASRGIPFDPENFRDCLLAVQDRFPHLRPGLAGGLSGLPGVLVRQVGPSVAAGVRGMFVDAAVGLRPSGTFSPRAAYEFVYAAQTLIDRELIASGDPVRGA
jgi:hypothetical protein